MEAFVNRCRQDQLGVQAQLLDVGENVEGAGNLALLNDLLQILSLYEELVDYLLLLR